MSDARMDGLAATFDDTARADAAAAEAARAVPPPAEVAELAAHPSADVRLAFAANPAAPADLLDSLTRPTGQPAALRCAGCTATATATGAPATSYVDVTVDAASAAAADPAGGEPATGDADSVPWCGGHHEDVTFMIHRAVAENPATPAAAVNRLLRHPDMWVRCGVAARADLSPEALRQLAEDPTPGVRGALAENPALPETLMRTVAADARTRHRLARNPALPLDMLIDLIRTIEIGPTLLPRIAAAGPDEVDRLAASPFPAVRRLLAHRPDLPADVIERLAADPDPDTLRAVAAQRNASVTALRRCLDDAVARPTAARHPALPPEIVAELATDPDERVRAAAAANPSLPRLP